MDLNIKRKIKEFRSFNMTSKQPQEGHVLSSKIPVSVCGKKSEAFLGPIYNVASSLIGNAHPI